MILTATACSGASTSNQATDSSRQPDDQGLTTGDIVDPAATDTARAESPRVNQDALNEALIDAAWDDDVALAGDLVAAGGDVNYKDRTQQSAYLIATSEGYLQLLELTFEHGADVTSLDSYDGTGLIRAAERGHADVVGRLVQAGIDVDHINNLGWTALHEAIILGTGGQRYVDTVRLLVAAGADLMLPTGDGIAPLRLARDRGQADVASAIQVALAAEPPTDPDAALLAAAASGDADDAAVALAAGADIETRDSNRRTPLLLAATNDHADVARLIVALGADPNALDDRHDTPWLVTGVTGSVAMAEILLAANPDLTILNRFGGTSLIPASERGHVDYVARVLHTEIDINHVNDLGWTALMETVLLGDGSEPHQRIVTLLLDAGADPTIADRDGITPAQHAATNGHDTIVKLLQ